MPFSLVLQGYPKEDIPVAHLQGHILHAMFFHLLEQIDPELAKRLHQDNRSRPFTLSAFTESLILLEILLDEISLRGK